MRDATKYTKWISNEVSLPPLKVGPSSLAACDRMMKKMRQSRDQLVQHPSWENFMAFVHAKASLLELFTLHSALSGHLSPAEGKDIEQRHNRQMRSYERFMRKTADHPMLHILRGWVRRKRNPLSKPVKALLVSQIDDIVAHRGDVPSDPTEILERQYFRRTQRVRSTLERAPFVIPAKQVRLLPKDLKIQCRQFAQSIGLSGYAVPPNRNLGYEIGSFFSDALSRWDLEDYLMGHAENDQTTSTMIDLRTSRARKKSYDSFAHQQLDGAAVSSPRKAIGALACALERMGPAYDKMAKAASRRMQKAGFERAYEMDVRHFLRQVYDYGVEAPKGAFPIAATLRKAIPELVRCGGWSAGRARRIQGYADGWAWSLVSDTGEEAELLIFPEAKISVDKGLAEHMPVRGVLSPAGNVRGLALINMYVEQATGFFSPADLTTLCHEVGHALHGLITPPNALIDPMEASGADMLEFPSQLLELYARDPKVLARWSKQGVNAEFSKPSYWSKVLMREQYGMPDHLRDLLSAWSDISLHATPYRNPVVSQHYAKGLKRFGLPANYAPELPYMGFVWDNYAGYYFCYPMGAALARHLGMLHSSEPLPNSRDIARTFKSLQDQVLRKTEDIKTLRRYMSEWTGLEFGDLVSQAMDNYGKVMAREYRIAARAIAALPPLEV